MLADLGMSPVANDYVDPAAHAAMEPFYPLEVHVCSECRLAQTRDVLRADDIFRADYAYFSSHSRSWVAHAERYFEMMRKRFGLETDSRIVEIASNDGYLLQFAQRAGIPCLGIEPCASVALAARAKGIDTRINFFDVETANALTAEGLKADLVTANNVLAHVPRINDFVSGIAILLKPNGIATFEVQHLLRLMQHNQFDTIYHEHFSYLSMIAARRIFAAAGLRVFDVEELDTHGGSLRLFVCHDSAMHPTSYRVEQILDLEVNHGLNKDATYSNWAASLRETKRSLLSLMISLKNTGKSIAGYGAPAKGVTLLNYCGIATDFVDFTVDRAPSKQDRLMPGVHIPILAPEAIFERRPDFVLILPWNLKDEIKEQCSGIRSWGGRFVVPIPRPVIED
jgi:2-polyprenyl-3-methyl-5-hydroxy-6-metoxy-1,4-benzoquinol methylase